jgi:hypothetical protein
MRHAQWLVVGALCLAGCPESGGSAGGGGNAGGSTGEPQDMEVRPDGSGEDGRIPAGDAARPADAAVAPPDAEVPVPDAAPSDADAPAPDGGRPKPDGTPPVECQPGETRACGDCPGATQACVDGVFGACDVPAETCNGLDDDCDGMADEAFEGLGDPCDAGGGACLRVGTVVCAPDGSSVLCDATPAAPEPETCDGIDNNCDGVVDEGLTQACYDGPAGTEGIGTCAAGVQTCVAGAFGACEGVTGPADETCNGLDDDCDGVVDEDAAGLSLFEACYEGPDGTIGQGLCRAGSRRCEAGVFGPCEGQAVPGLEICDGNDNDCDGLIDDGVGACDCVPGAVRACYTGPAGTQDVGPCVSGLQTCDADGTYGPCEGEIVPDVESCDGADNDCNGEADDAVAGTGAPCELGVGACRVEGETVCDDEQGRVVCAAQEGQPAEERCNGEDDDCDGETDEGFALGDACGIGLGACAAIGTLVCDAEGGVTCDASPGEPRDETCNRVDDDCDGLVDEGLGLGDACSVGVGLCAREGALICGPDGGVVCSAEAGGPAPEACDGLDNDCDGQVDEDNPGGGQDCDTGAQGVCAAGRRVCQEGAYACEGQAQAAPETCDGLDNDCDGSTDEDANGAALSVACYEGAPGTAGVGPCRGGLSVCDGGRFGGCEGQIVPQAEACDSTDNDCNGRVDDLPAGACVCQPGTSRACYTGPAGTANVGVCAGGTQACLANGQGYGPCQGEVLPGAEVCDGRDNDCNGRDDDAPGAGVACTNGQGECRRDGQLACNARTGQLECNAAAAPPQAEICDNRDNDCNGQVDDVAGLGDRCSNGVGVCERAGNRVCDLNARQLVCNAVAGQGGAEVCDGEDDDCDGTTDEDSPGVGDRCVVGVGACRAVGVNECRGAGGVQCSVQEGPASPELCDGIDNDCDGQTDDSPVDVGRACTVGVGACQAPGTTVCLAEGSLTCRGNPLPPQIELCNDVDDDCDGQTDEGLNCNIFRSCADAKQRGQNQSAIYRIAPDGVAANAASVHCDMVTDGGGWTLVGSTSLNPPNDQASEWYLDLVRLDPAAANPGIWRGLRPLGQRFDVRFSCRASLAAADAAMDVDLSFYDVPWYTEFTTGSDADSCFSESNGAQADSRVPARRNNRTQAFRRREDPYNFGYFEGEDSCGAADDFAVDFDDRGMDSNQSDGTEWGEDDGFRACGRSNVATGQWFVWARERPRAAVVGLSARVTDVLRAQGLLAETLVYDAALPARLTTENFDTIVIGRYASAWQRMTQDLREALDIFARNGGNIVTEWDGAAIFGSGYDATYLSRANAPTPLGHHTVRIGGGQSRGNNTAVTLTAPTDPLFTGVANPFQAGGATEFFAWLDHAVPPTPGGPAAVLSNLRTVATFPGGTPAFPAQTYGAVYRGRYCSGNAVFATFDFEDDPSNAGFGPLLGNLVREASAPPPADLPDTCQDDRRPEVLLCGTSQRALTEFGVTGRIVQAAAGQCVPGANTQAMFVTRNGVANLNAAAWRSYVQSGGIIITEFSASDEVFNAVFAPNPAVVQAANRSGACADNVMPIARRRADDSFWQDNQYEATAVNAAGCGHDVSTFPDIIPLGGWDANTVQVAYRDLGRGRVWLVEADWQDTQATMTAASKGLLRYMHLHRAQGAFDRGAAFSGVRVNQSIHTYLKRGFQPCLQTVYNSTLSLSEVRDNCSGDVLMMACRRIDDGTLTVAAMGSRAEVLEDIGDGVNAVNPHNGVNWYYSTTRSWGFAPAGAAVNRNSCDTNGAGEGTRLCWHTNADRITGGYRCGSTLNLNGDATWERVILHRNGDVPVDVVIQ